MVPDEPGGDERDAALAATIAPTGPTPPAVFPARSLPEIEGSKPRPVSAMEVDQTMAAPLSTAAPNAAGPGSQLPTIDDGLYKQGQEIARGGMGKIVAAEDQRLGRPVALKVLLEPAGDALGRFQREALITARLQHPGIVPVYEAGLWPSGEPFFAMKMVSGKPLDRVIADALTFEDRLALLPRVASASDAIAYAHSQRIVHRDLKPGNVLIGEFGETVVIDWGLAKDLDAGDSPDSENRRGTPAIRETALERPTAREIPRERDPATSTGRTIGATSSPTLTVAGAVMGTPAYMAPEQARGESVDQRADVFALGAMLYHLLAGVPPYNARTATDVIAAAALGRVVPLLEREARAPRDLVAIVERAMDPIPEKRYANAGALADELRRFLTGQLVAAHRYTRAQKLARWIKKHRAAVTIGALSIVVIAVAGTLAVRQIVYERDVAQYERTLADTRRMAAERLIDKMLTDVKQRLAHIGRLDVLANLGAQIREYYAVLATIPGGMPSGDVSRMAVAVELIGRAERDSGKTEIALKTWTDVRDQVAALVGKDTGPDTLGARAMLARLDFQIGTIYQGRGKVVDAVAAYEKARDGFVSVLAQAPNLRQALLHAGENHDRLGDLLRNDGKLDKASEAYGQAKSLRQRAMALATDNPSEEILGLSTSHLKVGSVQQARGNTKQALGDYQNSLRLRETLLEGQPDNVELQERVIEVQSVIAELQRHIGDDAAAIQSYSNARPILEGMLRRDPNNASWRRLYGNLLAELGFTMLDSGQFKGGLETLERAVETQKELVDRDSTNTAWQFDLSRSYTRAGDGQIYLGAVDEGIAVYKLGLEIRRKLVKGNPKNVPYRRSVAWSRTKLGNAHVHKGDLSAAIDEHEKALAIRTALVDEAPKQSAFKNELAMTEITLGKLIATRDAKRGADLVQAGLERARALVAADAINHEWRETLTQGLIARADVAKIMTDPATRKTSLDEARAIAKQAADEAPQNAQWPVFLAEIHSGLAELDPRVAAAEWKIVRELLEPLEKAGRLYALRKPLLDRARAGR